MKKKSTVCREVEKSGEAKTSLQCKLPKKDRNLIKFNIEEETLRCFIGKNKAKSFRGEALESKDFKGPKAETVEVRASLGDGKQLACEGRSIVWEGKDSKTATTEAPTCRLPALPTLQPSKTPLQAIRYKSSSCLQSSTRSTFHNKLLLMDYEQNQLQEKGTTEDAKGEEQEQGQEELNEIISSCMRVITQETQHSSNPVSQRYTPVSSEPCPPAPSQPYTPVSSHQFNHIESTLYTPISSSAPFSSVYPNSVTLPMQSPTAYYPFYPSFPTGPQRNRRSITSQESGAYVIDVFKVQTDGRTTIMVRNIPNKYTQDMLLQLFQRRHKKKFDFFYLPIDYNNSCNVGYAFLNFIHTKFIPDFMNEFHDQKWSRFNSTKVCKICYARIQGTAQLENHFEHSNVLQQKQKKYRPLIGMKSLEEIQELVKRQKQGQKVDQKGEESQKERQGERDNQRKEEFYE